MDRLWFNSGNSGILESTQEYLGITWGSYGNDSGMTWEYLGDSGRVRDMTMSDFGGEYKSATYDNLLKGEGIQVYNSAPQYLNETDMQNDLCTL